MKIYYTDGCSYRRFDISFKSAIKANWLKVGLARFFGRIIAMFFV